jgi:hypothetical protein
MRDIAHPENLQDADADVNGDNVILITQEDRYRFDRGGRHNHYYINWRKGTQYYVREIIQCEVRPRNYYLPSFAALMFMATFVFTSLMRTLFFSSDLLKCEWKFAS